MALNSRTRRVANLINLSTPLGLLVARVGGATVSAGPGGLRLADGYRLGFPVAVAFTVGDVLITRHGWTDLQQRRPGLLEHEAAHSEQYAWCGPVFLPAYVLATAWSWLRTGDRGTGNVFERRAGLRLGGYPEVPVTPLSVRLKAAVRRSGRSRAGGPNGSAGGSPGGGGVA
ncbi:MAG: hypothetical protein ACR2LI_13275 [Propionibacteriaceae bacterium]